MGTVLDGLCTIRLLKGIVKGRSKDSGSRLLETLFLISIIFEV